MPEKKVPLYKWKSRKVKEEYQDRYTKKRTSCVYPGVVHTHAEIAGHEAMTEMMRRVLVNDFIDKAIKNGDLILQP